MCKDQQNKTLHYYNHNAKSYKERTDSIDLGIHHDKILERIETKDGCRLLDLGCGAGRDTKIFLKHGFDVTSVDGSHSMIKLVSSTDATCRTMLFEQLDYFQSFEVVWASASLLHLNKKTFISVLRRVRDALKDDGLFYLSLKEGTADYVDENDRFFSTYESDELLNLLNSIHGFEVKDLWQTESLSSDIIKTQKWLCAIVEKRHTSPLYSRFCNHNKFSDLIYKDTAEPLSNENLEYIQRKISLNDGAVLESKRQKKFVQSGGFLQNHLYIPKNKLVRDKIPDMIGDQPQQFRRVHDTSLLEHYLAKKLKEEFFEYQKSESLEEICDIAEVLDKIAEHLVINGLLDLEL